MRQSQLSAKSIYTNEELLKIRAEGSGLITADVLANPGFTTQADYQLNPKGGDLGTRGSVATSANGTGYPKRLRYPASEVSTNGVEVSKQGNIGGLVSKVFWQQ